jgi:TolB-like protein/tetratricopeptide (TPR) repeat protein
MIGGRLYHFGRFRLDTGGRLLFRGDERILLTPKAVDILVALLERRGTPVGRDELLTTVWSDAAVEEGTLSSHISLLRKALGRQFIETIPKRGYRFVGAVEERSTETASANAARILLAVLPFENLSGNRKHDSFSDGLTEEMITQLGRLNPRRLGVIARTSSMTYKSTDKTIEQIGRELNVSHILEGSVRRAGGRVRIAAQLIQVSDQTHLWAESYEAEMEDIFALQSRVARAVAGQIQIKLGVEEAARRVVPAAYDACLKARFLWNRRTDQDLQTSIRCFRSAIEADPAYASPYVGVADCYLTLLDHGHLSLEKAAAEARPLLAKALQLDEKQGEAHVSLGHCSFHEFDWATAEREFLRGIELNPSYYIARHYYSNYLVATSRFQEAIAEAEEATRLDPVSPAPQSNLSSILWHSRQFDRAVAEAEKALDLNRNYARGYEDLGRAREQAGAIDGAIEAFQTSLSIEESQGTRASLAYACTLAGRSAEAMAILRQLEETAQANFVSAYSFALIHLGLGHPDEALNWLEKAYDERSSAVPFLNVNPRFASMHGDARFKRLIGRLGLGHSYRSA